MTIRRITLNKTNARDSFRLKNSRTSHYIEGKDSLAVIARDHQMKEKKKKKKKKKKKQLQAEGVKFWLFTLRDDQVLLQSYFLAVSSISIAHAFPIRASFSVSFACVVFATALALEPSLQHGKCVGCPPDAVVSSLMETPLAAVLHQRAERTICAGQFTMCAGCLSALNAVAVFGS